MNIDLKKLVRVSDFKPETKTRIMENMETLTPEARLELWGICLENLLWKVETEKSKRFHTGVLKGVISGQDNTDYTKLEKDILLEIFTKAEMEVRHDEIAAIHDLIVKHKNSKQTSSDKNILVN